MIRDGQPIGAIFVGRRDPGPFGDEQIRLLRTFADQAVIAIENARLLGALQARNADLTEALRGFTAFAETAEPEEVMGVLREYHAEMGRLILAHEGTLERFTGAGMMVFFEAAAGQILVSARVASAVEDLVEAEDVGPVALKGLARPVSIWSVRGLTA